MKFGVREWILVVFGAVFILFAAQSFRMQHWGVFIIDIGVISIIGWQLLQQRRDKTGDGKNTSNRVDVKKSQSKGQ